MHHSKRKALCHGVNLVTDMWAARADVLDVQKVKRHDTQRTCEFASEAAMAYAARVPNMLRLHVHPVPPATSRLSSSVGYGRRSGLQVATPYTGVRKHSYAMAHSWQVRHLAL